MNKLQKVLGTIACGATLALAGCKEYITECSNLEQENVKVVNKEIATFTFQEDYITFKGDKEVYRIRNQKWCDQFEIGDSVQIKYRERYRLTFDDTNNDGRNDFIESRYIDKVFLDAQFIGFEKR